MTIDGLNALTTLTAGDELPVWDVEASAEEPTKKITAQNMAASVKTLGSLVNTNEMNSALAGKQNTLTFDTTPTTGSMNPVTSGGIADAIAQSTASLVAPLSWDNGTKPTLSNGSHYRNGVYYWKRGSLIYLHISVQFDNAPTHVLLFTLPTGYRPIGYAEITVSGGGSYNAQAQCTIDNGGSVYVTSVDKWVTGSGLFICST